jgi:hypothetical protein
MPRRQSIRTAGRPTVVSVEPLEAVYVVINLTAFLLTLSALVDARADSQAVKLLNGQARELAAAGNVRREALRIVVLLLLLSIVVPGLHVDREIPLSPLVVALMGIPLVLLASTVFDSKDRRAMTAVVAADLLTAGNDHLQRIEDKLDRNTQISQEASEHADAAYHEANDVNNKIASQGLELVDQGKARADAAAEEAGT